MRLVQCAHPNSPGNKHVYQKCNSPILLHSLAPKSSIGGLQIARINVPGTFATALMWAAPPPEERSQSIPTARSAPWVIGPGPDGGLWFTEAATNKIGRLQPPIFPNSHDLNVEPTLSRATNCGRCGGFSARQRSRPSSSSVSGSPFTTGGFPHDLPRRGRRRLGVQGASSHAAPSFVVILLGAELDAKMEYQSARDTTTGVPRPLGQRGAQVADTVVSE
jgi:hypothetical protein